MSGIRTWFNNYLYNRAFNISNQRSSYQYQWWVNKPNWISLSCPEHYEKAARFNPIVKSTINLLSTASSNGGKIAVDINTGETIPWTEKNEAIRKAYQLLVIRPNPMQSAKEFAFQGTFYVKTFGNRYTYASMPTGFDSKIDLLNINTLVNLPSQFVDVKTTGKIYDQSEIGGIIEKYALSNIQPSRDFFPHTILHFNEVNISSEMATIMGISKLEALKWPISNTQAAFEAMNTILTSRGMQGIISPKKTDGTGAPIPLTPNEKIEVDKKFKGDYGLLNNQNPFLLSPVPLEFIKSAMNSKELGIYEEFSNNSILISNEYGVPPELVKTYIQGSTYENQIQSVRRLYQDTIIPMVEDEDLYWSYRLDTFKYGFQIKTTWDHIPALQEAFKERASALNLKGRTGKDAYDLNIITWNEYRELLGEKPVSGGDVYKHERKTGDGNNGQE